MRAGSELVQLYIHQLQEKAGRPVPIKKLVDFQKIQLEAGEEGGCYREMTPIPFVETA
jgi:hypothetical protein